MMSTSACAFDGLIVNELVGHGPFGGDGVKLAVQRG